MYYHQIWLLERLTKDNQSMEIEAERMRRAVDREWFFTRVLDWLKEQLLEMQATKTRPVSLVHEERHPKHVIYSCPIIVAQSQDEQH
jgi:hypothetical protein